ncbi:GNAT family N-acetyltransferase [Pseudonocardia sp. HH130630-07]|uniref:GNAT family N-acetyltransferase n=1 Tax=Pseudonocardia sp. HH130630-07 TaxID=1690815 RepID=UPI00081518D6|nr:GNAT family N-acetyltransferase [Pseudonocardia sp. HH130630-07]ANY05150.1 acetyltransferase [Pseudonocardia sp. HH130630-07]
MAITYEWRGTLDDTSLGELFTEAGHATGGTGRVARLHRHSLGWVCARDESGLVGFVNVAWDGGTHAFLLDPVVRPARRHAGIGSELVGAAVRGAAAAGCAWLHVDFAEDLRPFYRSCGFRPTEAGLVAL